MSQLVYVTSFFLLGIRAIVYWFPPLQCLFCTLQLSLFLQLQLNKYVCCFTSPQPMYHLRIGQNELLHISITYSKAACIGLSVHCVLHACQNRLRMVFSFRLKVTNCHLTSLCRQISSGSCLLMPCHLSVGPIGSLWAVVVHKLSDCDAQTWRTQLAALCLHSRTPSPNGTVLSGRDTVCVCVCVACMCVTELNGLRCLRSKTDRD